MLFAVNEYCQDRDDPREPLWYQQVGSLVGGEYQLKQVYLFKQLVVRGIHKRNAHERVEGRAFVHSHSDRGPHEARASIHI